jgi:hypothetical protein
MQHNEGVVGGPSGQVLQVLFRNNEVDIAEAGVLARPQYLTVGDAGAERAFALCGGECALDLSSLDVAPVGCLRLRLSCVWQQLVCSRGR